MVNLPRILTLAYRSRMKTKNWHRLVRAMAMVVVFCTTYALILPAITMESGTVCGITAHSHTEQCYETVTVLHSHDESCYSRTAICGIEEHPAHSHLAECTGFVPTLICELPEEGHRHNAACYSYEQGLVCELEESEGHTHSEACWKTDLICGLSENQEVSVTNLVCGMEEHVHVESCYPAPTETTAGETLPAMGNPNADVETESDWLESFASVELTEDWSENLLSLANSQLGYAESKYNLSHDQQGNIYGYTRYGAWYGQPYGPWDAKFIAFCLHYAGVEGIPYDADTEHWLETLTEEGLYQAKADHQPNPGDLVFLDRDYDEKADHAAILYQIQPETGILELIAGDWNHRVDRVEVDEAAVLGYVPLPQEPSEEENSSEHYVSVSEDGITAEVQLNTALPAGAELTVTPIGEESEGYAAMAAQIEEALSENIEKLTLLDLSFMVDGEYHSVSDNATVTLCFDGDIFAGRQVKVFHFTENGPTELNSTATTFSTFSLRDEAIQTHLTFETEGFSVFAVVEVVGEYERVTTFDVNNMAGEYYIHNYYGTSTLTPSVSNATEITSAALMETYLSDSPDLSSHTLWTVEAITTDTSKYYIYYTDTSSVRHYLQMTKYTDQLANLILTTEQSEASEFFFTAGTGGDSGKVSIGSYVTDKAYYINEHGGTTTYNGFTGWHEGTSGSFLQIYRKAVETDATIPATNLGGKTFAIVSNYVNKALTTTSVTVNNVPGLQAKDISIVTIEGSNYVEGDNPLWTFEATDTAGVYHISTTSATGDKQYLRLLSQDYSSTSPDGRGSLTVETTDSPQAITVLTSDDGTIMLSAKNSNGNTGYVNLDTAVNNFWTYNGIADSNQLRLYSKANIDSSFTVTFNNFSFTVHLQDMAGTPLYAAVEDQTLDNIDTDAYQLLSAIAPDIRDYVYIDAKFDNHDVAAFGPISDNEYRLYTPDYVANRTYGQWYTKNTTDNVQVFLRYSTTQYILNYNLNVPTPDGGSGWHNTPNLPASAQEVTTDVQNLLTVQNENEVGSFVYNILNGTGRARDVISYYNSQNTAQKNAGTLTADNYLAPGTEYRFIGWKVTVDGEDHIVSPNATVVLLEDGKIQISDGQTVLTVPKDTVLVGQWDYISSVVLFFVNFNDTMLEHDDLKLVPNFTAEYYTDIVAIGHIYNPVTYDPGAPDIAPELKNRIQRAWDEKIQAEITPIYDPAKDGTQIVIDAVTVIENGISSYTPVSNLNQSQLESAVGAYLQNDPNQNTGVKLGGAEIDKSTITSKNYKLYWYLQKLVGQEGWHIDGVLVAKTQPMEIYKTFSGLTKEQADDAIAQMTFPLHLVSQVTLDGAEVDKKNAYTTLKAANSQSGVYTFDDRQTEGNIFKWTLESVQGQRYTFEEDDYDVTGYDCSSLVSVHYADGAVVYKYNTDATYTDATGNTDAITDLFADKPLEGGQVESIIFANFYTPTGTGMFSISKVADDFGQVRLPGAEFTLTQGDAVISNQTTNENGSIHFSDLKPGTYTLKETKAPTGYQKLDTTWTVVVAKDNDKVTVTIQKQGETTTQTLYDSGNGGIQDNGIYQIKNEPENTTVTVTKDFSDQLTDIEIGGLTNYKILVKDTSGNAVRTLILNDATPITGSINAYSWTLDLECGKTYQFVESGYSHKNYLDTVVSASVNGVAQTVTKSENNAEASFSMVKGQSADTVYITNDYTNTFDLRIHKVNATAKQNEDPNMSGVKFNIYGDFQFHQQPPAGTSESISYTYDGAEGTAWYIGTTAETGTDGYTLFRDMHLTSGTDTFLYVIDEANTPAGFVKLDEPIVRVVRVNGGDPNYSNGVYTLTVENFMSDLATVTVTATKQWELPEGMNPAEVTLTLYKKNADNAVSPVQTVTLDGSTSSVTEEKGITASIDDWTVVWSGLTYADGATPNVYYVAETPMDGYNTSYSTHVSTYSVGTKQIEMALAEGYNLKRYVTITNSSGYELPSTGSLGVGWIYILGLGLMGAALWLHRLDVIKKRQGGVNSS